MERSPSEDSVDIERLLQQAAAGDGEALGQLFGRHRQQLARMVRLRMDRRLQGRIDASDVLQEAFIEAADRLEDYLQDRSMPFFLWLRFLAGQRLLMLHRRHLGAQARNVEREISLYGGALPEVTSAVLAAQLVGKHTTPTQAVMRAELQVRLQEALNSMDEVDREVLALRHFEQLSNVQAAQVLGLNEAAASKRYIRALRRLKDMLLGMPGT